jgi:hypothetical protein
MSTKLVQTFVNRGCRVVNATDPHGRILGFLDRSPYYFFQVVSQLYSRGWVDPVPDPLLLRISGSAGNRTRYIWICSHKLWPLDHRGGLRKVLFQTLHELYDRQQRAHTHTSRKDIKAETVTPNDQKKGHTYNYWELRTKEHVSI